MTWEHIFEAIYISFSNLNLAHEMSLRQKGTYAPLQDQAWGLNIHDRIVLGESNRRRNGCVDQKRGAVHK
jgi:hypothetical protein